MQYDLIILDGDDTLWETEPLYDIARDNCKEYINSIGLDGDKWDLLQRKFDLERVKTLGFSPERFPGSCVMAYEELVKNDKDHLMCQDHHSVMVEDISSKVFNTKPLLYDDTVDSVIKLRSMCNSLVLLTKGDVAVQKFKINCFPDLNNLFDGVHIVYDKTYDSFKTILDKMNASASNSVSIGNSYRSDIEPAIMTGMKAFWLDRYVWDHEKMEMDRVKYSCLSDVVSLMEG
jgi:putative hydrolase of the HAD superfamily